MGTTVDGIVGAVSHDVVVRMPLGEIPRDISVLGQPSLTGSPEHPELVEKCDFTRPASFHRLRMLDHFPQELIRPQSEMHLNTLNTKAI